MKWRIICFPPPHGDSGDGGELQNLPFKGMEYPVDEKDLEGFLSQCRERWTEWVFVPIPDDVTSTEEP